ncbi:PepSY-associated TM helix domain-containing protein [Gynurincola endophyticus]|uniref:PepSY-associated TM helix domain-containing protein n=1 Tax=Gynurincola endophyticus TaxID=2479004 RepID=UPI000F8F55D1|nr:PepSY-associated TM helix domain-containing protein [Gynurincola endophyticus]
MKNNLYFLIHKWLGIVCGIIVFIVCITGCIYTFYDELKLKVYPDRFLLENTDNNRSPLPLSSLIKAAQAALPGNEPISRVDLYPAKDRSWVFRAQGINTSGIGYNNYYPYYWRVFVNPYTGEIVKLENTKYEFFQIILQLHRNLTLGDKIGSPIVGTATIIFILLLISGMILWWPKNWKWKTVKRVVWIDSTVKWKRLMYDIHNVSGFYSFLIAMIVAITGVFYSFEPIKKEYGNFFNQFSTVTQLPAAKAAPINVHYDDPLDNVLYYTLHQHARADMMSIRLRGKDAAQLDIQVRLAKNRTGDFKWYYFDGNGQSIKEVREGEKLPLGDRLISLNYDLHTGSVWGMPSKIIVFIISLFCAGLPVTGYIMWWNKQKKKSSKLISNNKIIVRKKKEPA